MSVSRPGSLARIPATSPAAGWADTAAGRGMGCRSGAGTVVTREALIDLFAGEPEIGQCVVVGLAARGALFAPPPRFAPTPVLLAQHPHGSRRLLARRQPEVLIHRRHGAQRI